ncbi:MAG: TonB-dependent receptor plug domain-containing protein, partial [Sphingomonadales bacterium]
MSRTTLLHRLPTAVSFVALVAAVPGIAHAQAAPPPGDTAPVANPEKPDATTAQETPSSEQAIIVTGTRIRSSTTFNQPSPIDVITRNDAVLTGARSTAEQLQSATVTSGTSQVNEAFLGFVSEGGPAANTVGLRGLGSSRTLVLLNGRRLAPAGAGPQLISADLNVLPTTVVQRVEILREGASSIYGSDAIAGVINIITDTKMNGITFDAYTDQPIEHGGGGRNYRASVVGGKTWDGGHITASVEYRQLTGMRVRDRKDFTCPQDLIFDPATHQQLGQLDLSTGKPRCFPFQTGAIGTAQDYALGLGFVNRVHRYTYANGDINSPFVVDNFDKRPLASARQLDEHVISPLKTYTAFLDGAVDVFGNSE